MAFKDPGVPLVSLYSSDANASCMQLIQSGQPHSTSILIDPGTDLAEISGLNSKAHHLNRNQAWPQLLTSGLIPRIPQLWDTTLPGFTANGNSVLRMLKASGNFSPAQYRRAREELLAHGNLSEEHTVIVTHAQFDSTNLMPYLDPDIPILTTAATHSLLAAWETESGAPDHEFTKFLHRERAKVKGKYPRTDRRIAEVQAGVPMQIGGFAQVMLSETSHFLGSMALEATFANGARLVATGDIGPGEMTEEFIAGLAGSRPEILALDAKHIGDQQINQLRQGDLVKAFDQIMQRDTSRQQGNWIAELPVRHLERLGALIEIAQRTKRQIFLPLTMAFYLEQMQGLRDKYPQIAGLSDVGIYLPPGKSCLTLPNDYPKALRSVAFSDDGHLRGNVLTMEDLTKQFDQDRMVVVVNEVQDLLQLAASGQINSRHPRTPVHGQANTSFATQLISTPYQRSASESLKWQRARKAAGLAPENTYELQVTDHLSRMALLAMVAKIQPQVIIPLHTQNPSAAAAAFAEVAPGAHVVQAISRGRLYGFYGGKVPFHKAKF